MNQNLKNEILSNEEKLIKNCHKYKQSINQFMKKLEKINYDGVLYDFVIRSFGSNEKIEQENFYNMQGFKSARQIINERIGDLNLADRPRIETIVVGQQYSPLEICSLAGNYNNQVGMYYLPSANSVIIKSTVEDNDRPYDDKWLLGDDVLRYFMQSEDSCNVQSLVFSHKPNAVIFNSLMKREMVNVYTFVNRKKGENYVFKGIYHPCGLVSNNKAFLLFKDGCENEIPLDNLEAQFFMPLLKNGFVPESSNVLVEAGSPDEIQVMPNKKIPTSKRNKVQQLKIEMEVSLRGENLIVYSEKCKLKKCGHGELAELVKNISLENSEIGYDIKSFYIDSSGGVNDLFIKVKACVDNKSDGFDLTELEYESILKDNKSHKLYKVYNLYTNCPKYLDITNDLYSFDKHPTSYHIFG